MESYPSLKQRLAIVLADESTTDVTFLVGDNQIPIRAHSMLLSPPSDAFKNMFYGSFNRERTVEVPDGTAEGFRALLSYIYTDDALLTHENVGSALYLSNKYAVSGLYKDCIKFLKANVNAENVGDLLEAAELYKEVKQICDDVFFTYSGSILRSEGFQRLSRDMMTRIIASDELRAEEMTVYERAVDWAKHHLEGHKCEVTPSSIREALDNAIYHIRFPLMELEDFAAGPGASGILLHEDRLGLCAWFASGKKTEKFCCKPRKPSPTIKDVNDFLGMELESYHQGCPHMNKIRDKPKPPGHAVCVSTKAVVETIERKRAGCRDPSSSVICLHCAHTAFNRQWMHEQHSLKKAHPISVWEDHNYIEQVFCECELCRAARRGGARRAAS